MLIGFTLVLAVFAVSAAATWLSISGVEEGNKFVMDRIIPAQTACSDMNEAAYELILAVRALRMTESDESAAEVAARRTDAENLMAGISALHESEPGLEAAAYQVETVFPRIKDYFTSIEQALAGITAKKAAFSEIMGYAESMSKSASELHHSLAEYIRKDMAVPNARILALRLQEMEGAGRLALLISEARRDLLGAAMSDDPDALGGAASGMDEVSKELADLMGALYIPEHRRMMADLTGGLENYKTAVTAYIEAHTALEAIYGAQVALRDAVNQETSNAVRITQRGITESSLDGYESIGFTKKLLLWFAIFSIFAGFAVALLISRSIAKPLSAIVRLAERTGDGDLTVTEEEFGRKGKDELGKLADAMFRMINSQEEVIRKVVTVADEVMGSAGGLSAISEQTNASMEEVKASIDQVSVLSESNGAALEESNAGVEEMSAGADMVARSATDSAAFISETTDASNRAIQTVNDVISGMHDVNKSSKESEERIKELVASVSSVGGLVSMITSIAEQTNLLALNAAIEAARAGEVGRGFSVVAGEVRKLADESARTANSVNEIISELHNSAQDSISATAEAGTRLAVTLDRAERAQVELNNALVEMNKANDSIQNIAAVAQQQAASSKEVATAIDGATSATMEMVNTIAGIRHATDETARAAQGVAEHSETMSLHAQNLTDALSRFKLKQGA